MDLYTEDLSEKHKNLLQKLEEFETYIQNNAGLIPNPDKPELNIED